MHMQEGQPVEVRVKLCEGSSLLSRIATAVAMVALVLHVISVSSAHWMEGRVREGSLLVHTGLWQDCVLNNVFTSFQTWLCASYQASHHIHAAPTFLKASQAFAILGILGHVATAVLLTIFILLPKLTNQRAAFIASLAANGISALFVLIALIVFPVNYPDRQFPPFEVTWSVSWCCALDIVSVLASLSVLVLLLVDFRGRFYHMPAAMSMA